MVMWYAWLKRYNLKGKTKNMDSQKQQASERIKQANNILVTVSNNPSVDQLAACIGLTIALNKMGKHATAVFSGAVPSTIEFLQPEKTLEKNTDSLRDFIIALDKSKADKLRYKVEDKVVKIFITPYKTSISDKDLQFSQGDFNVDVVLALGVHNQAELDQAITSHGRILHDATVVTLNVKAGGELGSINWLDPGASSLSELGVQLLDILDKKLLDTQIATALLTGIVAETDRFSNSRTSPQTMSLSAELMVAGANQQLVATKLEEPATPPPTPAAPIAHQDEGDHKEVPEEAKKSDDGTLEISHDDKPAGATEEKPVEEKHEEPEHPPEPEPKQEEKPEEPKAEEPPAPAPEPEPEPEPTPEAAPQQIHIDEHGSLSSLEDMLPPKPKEPPSIIHHSEAPKMVLEPPTLGGQLTASGNPGPFGEPNAGLGLPSLEPSSMSGPATGPTIVPPANNMDEMPSGGAARSDSYIVGGSGSNAVPQIPVVPPQGAPEPRPAFPEPNKTLTDIEKEVNSPHVATVADPVTPPAPTLVQPASPVTDNILPPLDGPVAPTNDIPQLTPSEPASAVPAAPAPTLDSARDAVMQAINASSTPALDPIQALNAQPVNLAIGSQNADMAAPGIAQTPTDPAGNPNAMPQLQPSPSPVIQPQFDAFSQPAGVAPQPQPQFSMPVPVGPGVQGQANDPNAPPPVPPPMMPPANPY
jgi:hypothetical protein